MEVEDVIILEVQEEHVEVQVQLEQVEAQAVLEHQLQPIEVAEVEVEDREMVVEELVVLVL